jgi:hypothetical protein
MWLALIAAPVFFAVAAYQYYGTLKLEKQGVQVVGAVVDSHPWRTVKGRTSYRITVDYLPKDHPIHRKQFVVPDYVFAAATRDSTIAVVYLPSDPTHSVVVETPAPRLEAFAVGAGLLLFATLVWLYLRRLTTRVQAYARGEA